ncbi:B9 domain-containing protein 2 [Thecamonas trahens ATCC 50062]|uniref:B9 domain-containing protein 2 n=1 Tax=Thecamonas trahens ATCC 50062 TaxID=461836 RepID=A0A0L0D3I7_THETB|nr:B9 domain-containing protein 2 [Thecamonas trahens ATCC 50062]KNC46775.1 B9 domain-containing protein 2 [Thecamonas trahens ATCC 50062]|eukprot:XP_013760052.1 B9 domain-containing protein 2 [Thecamonas trahens ATCC 50062]
MAEVHVIGEIAGASGFPSSSLFCKWSLEVGASGAVIGRGGEGGEAYAAAEGWRKISGTTSGRTQVDAPADDAPTVWAHPFDVHYALSTVVGWPRLKVEVWHQDRYGRDELYGYGFVHLPTAPGAHELDIATWRPARSWWDSLKAFFLGGSPELVNDDVVTAPLDRFNLQTESMGFVHVSVNVIHRHFAENDVQA